MTTVACKYCRSLGAAVAVLIGLHVADYDVGPIHIAQPWARATPKGAKSGAGYLTITNNGSTADRLSCVSSDASAKCQVHTMTMENGVMKMRPAEGGLEIKPGETVMLKPSSPHLMFLGLNIPWHETTPSLRRCNSRKPARPRWSFQSPQSERRPPALPRARQHR